MLGTDVTGYEGVAGTGVCVRFRLGGLAAVTNFFGWNSFFD